MSECLSIDSSIGSSTHVRRFAKSPVCLSVDAVCCVHCCVGGIGSTCCCVVLLCVAFMSSKTGGSTIVENERIFVRRKGH